MNVDGENKSVVAEFIWKNVLIMNVSCIEDYKITHVVVVGGLLLV